MYALQAEERLEGILVEEEDADRRNQEYDSKLSSHQLHCYIIY